MPDRLERPELPELIVALPQCQRDPDFPSAARQAAYAVELRALGTRSVLWAYETEAEAAVGALQRSLDLTVVPVVPNMRAYLRDASDAGVVGAARHRFFRLGPRDQLRIALRHVGRARKVLARDFTTGMLMLVEMELARFRPFRPRRVLLTASVTDLALALDRMALLRDFVGLAERSYGVEAGLATCNYGMLESRLDGCDIRPSWVAAPFNPRGYLMNPSRGACEAVVRRARAPVVATHVEVDGLVERASAMQYVATLGIHAAVIDA